MKEYSTRVELACSEYNDKYQNKIQKLKAEKVINSMDVLPHDLVIHLINESANKHNLPFCNLLKILK
jgi:hypothetical protein